MKKILKRALIAIAVASLVLGMANCGGSAALAGKWEWVKDEEASGYTFVITPLELLKDGTAIFGDSIDGEWKAEKDRITFTGWGITAEYAYKISGSTLTLTDNDGYEAAYQKVKK